MNAAEIQGWMRPEELHWLSEQGKQYRRIVELGCWKGRSTVALAQHGALVIAVDTFQGVPNDPRINAKWYSDAANVFAEFIDNVSHLKVSALQGTTLDQVQFIRDAYTPIDMVFIDADHRYEAVKADILAYRPLLEHNGLLCGHDYHADCPGVMRAVDELLSNAKIGPGSIWSVQV